MADITPADSVFDAHWGEPQRDQPLRRRATASRQNVSPMTAAACMAAAVDSRKAQLANIQCIDEGIDHASGIAFVNPVIEAFRTRVRFCARF